MSSNDTQKGRLAQRETRDLTPFEEMDRLFHQFFSDRFMRPFDVRWPEWTQMHGIDQHMPRVDVIDREDEVLVKVEIPGMEKDAIDVSISDDVVTIKGETREETEEKGEIYRSEIHRGSFARRVRMPCTVKGEEAKANFNNGVLEITVPKAKQVKKVSVPID